MITAVAPAGRSDVSSPQLDAQPLSQRAPVADIDAARRARLLSRRAPFDAAYWKTIGECARRAPGVATGTEYLRDHGQAWAARLELVNRAQRHIVCTTYCIEPDEFGIAYLDALIAAQKRGVEVALAVDGLAQRFVYKGADPANCKALESMFATLRAGGATVRHFGGAEQQAKLVGSGMHAKLLVVDGDKALAGGRNVGANYYGHLFNDFEMRFSGPIARQFQADAMTLIDRAPGTSFEEDKAWSILRAKLEQAPGPIALPSAPKLYHVVSWDPLHDGGEIMREQNRITLALLYTLQRARREITLTSNYVVGNAKLREALMDAAKLGIKVRIITTGESASHISKMAYRSTTPGYRDLAQAGVEIYETRNTPDHAKIFVVDDVAAFGSYNFSDYADERLAETLIFTADAADVAFMRNVLETSIATGCTRYDPDAKDPQPSFGERFKRWVGALVYGIRTVA